MNHETNDEWELCSNSGRESISGRLISVVREQDDVVLLFDVICRAERHDTYLQHVAVPHYELLIQRVPLGKANISQAIARLRAWLDAPVEMKLDLSIEKGRQVEFCFGQIERMICSLHQPACVFTYVVSFTAIELAFVVDQSCIRLFADSLDVVLNRASELERESA